MYGFGGVISDGFVLDAFWGVRARARRPGAGAAPSCGGSNAVVRTSVAILETVVLANGASPAASHPARGLRRAAATLKGAEQSSSLVLDRWELSGSEYWCASVS